MVRPHKALHRSAFLEKHPVRRVGGAERATDQVPLPRTYADEGNEVSGICLVRTIGAGEFKSTLRRLEWRHCAFHGCEARICRPFSTSNPADRVFFQQGATR